MFGLAIIWLIIFLVMMFVTYGSFNYLEKEIDDKARDIKKLDEKLFGRKIFTPNSFMGFTPGREGGLFKETKAVTDKNNDFLFTKIKALEDYLKINYIDEKLITNGEEKSSFKGYRKIEKKNS